MIFFVPQKRTPGSISVIEGVQLDVLSNDTTEHLMYDS